MLDGFDHLRGSMLKTIKRFGGVGRRLPGHSPGNKVENGVVQAFYSLSVDQVDVDIDAFPGIVNHRFKVIALANIFAVQVETMGKDNEGLIEQVPDLPAHCRVCTIG